MARTIDQIFGEMVVQKESTPALDGLTSTSKTAVWRLILYICAVGISIVENLFDLHTELIDQAANEAISGNLAWYAGQTLLYQHGDTLVFNSETGSFGYATYDPDLQVVKLSACTDDLSGAVYLKAAKINTTTNEAEPLSTEELNGLTGYWNQKKFAGTILGVFSDDPDKLQLALRVIYDATVLTATGELISDISIKPVEDAVYNYLIEFGINNFAGNFQLMKLVDAIQLASGVLNVVITTATARKYDDSVVIDILSETDQYYETLAGYIVIDPSYPLENYITYVTE